MDEGRCRTQAYQMQMQVQVAVGRFLDPSELQDKKTPALTEIDTVKFQLANGFLAFAFWQLGFSDWCSLWYGQRPELRGFN